VVETVNYSSRHFLKREILFDWVKIWNIHFSEYNTKEGSPSSLQMEGKQICQDCAPGKNIEMKTMR